MGASLSYASAVGGIALRDPISPHPPPPHPPPHPRYGTAGELNRCDGTPSPPSSKCNANGGAQDVSALINDIIQNRMPYVRGNDITIQLGDDFQWENAATGYFDYVDSVILALNKDPRFHGFYSTPANYVAAKLALPSLPALQNDLMPYNDDFEGHNVWAGYFTSRPAFKGFVRDSSSLMQSARQLQVIAGGVPDAGPTNPLFKLERAMGVAQHHDAVAGTAKQYVNDNYGLLLETGRADAYASVAASFATATGYSGAPFTLCPLSNVTLCPALEKGVPVVTAAYNSGGSPSSSGVKLSVGLPGGVAGWAVFDAAGKPVTAQLLPLSSSDTSLRAQYGGSTSTPIQWLAFVAADLPPTGFSVFFLLPVSQLEDAPHTHASTVRLAAADEDSIISNGRISLTVSAATGMLSSYADVVTGVNLPLVQTWEWYTGFDGKSNLNGSSQASGAYIFRPASETTSPVSTTPFSVTVVTGPVLNETRLASDWVFESVRLWAGATDVELEWTVGPVGGSNPTLISKEVVTKYATGLATNATWTTDSNCREGQLRQRNFRAGWKLAPSEAVSINYTPVNCLITTTGEGVTLAVGVDRSQGGTSMQDGTVELMVHRRMYHDDGRGVGEALNEPGLDGKGLIIRGRHWLSAVPAALAPAAKKALNARALSLPNSVVGHAPLGSLTPDAWRAQFTGTAQLLNTALPFNVALTTVHALGPKQLLVRLSHSYEIGEDAAGSAPASVDLATLFKGARIVSAVDMTLGGGQTLASVKPTVYTRDNGTAVTLPRLPPAPSGTGLTISLTVMQVRTFMCTLA